MSLSLPTYPDSVQSLYSLANETRTLKLGLDRMTILLEHLGNPHRKCRFVHVAGTNGKGSVCAMVESALRASGLRAGLFTSPHLVEPTERIRVDGVPVPQELFANAFDRVHVASEALLARGALDGHPTYFETITAMAFLLFADLAASIVVLEVGLGGRLDATNVVLPDVSVITPVDYDHEAYLGKSLEAIAGEKAGIMKPGVPVVTGPQHPAVRVLLEERAAAVEAPLHDSTDWRVEDLRLEAHGSSFIASGPLRLRIDCPLAGEHQVSNALTAIAALHILGIPSRAMGCGIATAKWPGRLEPCEIRRWRRSLGYCSQRRTRSFSPPPITHALSARRSSATSPAILGSL
jgi:dihydrofolate synthase/folylpolyglutamate synthase